MPDAVLEAALDQLPLAPLPAGFTQRVMTHVNKPSIRFRLQPIDVIVPLVSVLMLGLIVAAGWSAFLAIESTPPLPSTPASSLLVAEDMTSWAMLICVTLFGGILSLAAICTFVWLETPRYHV